MGGSRPGAMTQRARPKELWCPAVYLLLGLYLASLLVFTFRPVIGWPIPQSLGRASTLLIWAFALGHALWTLGWRHALVFFALAFFIGFTFEAVGIATGWVYGDYHYGPRLGPVMLGVPVLIPLSWFTVIYLALAVTERLADGASARTLRGAALSCVLGAVVATAWDVVVDPQMARIGLWIWEQPGEFFGVPVHNFLGWLATSLAVLASYRAATWAWPPRPLGASSPLFALLPVLAYGALALSYVVGYSVQGQGALAVVAFFTMGALTLTALAQGRREVQPGERQHAR